MMKNKEQILKLADVVEKGKIIQLIKHKKAILKYNYLISKFIIIPTDTKKEPKSIRYVESAYEYFEKVIAK